MFLMLIALFIMPVAFLYFAVKMGLTPLNTVCLALLSSTAFSCGCWTIINTPEKQKQAVQLFKEEFEKQLTVVEEQMKTQKVESSEYTESLENLRENFYRVADKAFLIVPSTVIFLWHLLSLGILYALAAWLGPKFGYKVEPFPAFKDWTFDWNLVWLYIIGWVLYFLIGGIEGLPGAKILQILGANCFIMSNILYLIIGFSLLFFMYDKYKIGPVTRVGFCEVGLLVYSIWHCM